MEEIPMSELFPKQNRNTNSDECCDCVPVVNRSYIPDSDGKLHINARPSTCDIIQMGPCCAFIGCCCSCSANVTFDDVSKTVRIINWPGYICIPPCLNWVTIPYSDIANVGLQDTGIKEGSEHNLQPIYDTILVTRQRKIYRVGERGVKSIVANNALSLHRFVFGRDNNNNNKESYKAPISVESITVPAHNDWCCCGTLSS